jgi:hypothetical protein
VFESISSHPNSIILITSLTFIQPILCHFLYQAPRERVVGKKIRPTKLLILLPGVTAADVDGSLSAFCTRGEQLELESTVLWAKLPRWLA